MAWSKTEAHDRWRAWQAAGSYVERWFTLSPLGHEAGTAPPTSSSRAFITRALGGAANLNGHSCSVWAEQNRITARLSFSHNLAQIFPPELYASHPEFFPMEATRRLQPAGNAQWWNPDLGRMDVAAYTAKTARDYFVAKPEAVSFALGLNDGLIFGESAETKALTMPVRWFRERPDYSNLVFTFMNRVAEDLERTHPDKYLGALAYYWAENAPDFPVHPQVIPFLTADRSQGYDRAFLREDRELQKHWIEKLREGGQLAGGARSSHPVRLGLYDYIYGGGFLVPRFHPHLLAQHLRYTRRLGFTDYYAEVYPNWGLDGPQPWLVAQLLQDPEQSADKLLDEYYRRYFKEAAGPMRRFFNRCEQQWMRQSGPAYWLKHYRNESQAVLFPSAICAELRALLDDATRQAKTEVVRARVKQVSDAFGVTERFVAMQEARDRLTRLALSEAHEAMELRRITEVFRATRGEFERYTKTLQREQPTLMAPFQWQDYLVNDPSAMALVAADGAGEDATWEKLTINGALAGDRRPVRMIAGLPYSLSLPEPWQSRVEPAEFHEAEVSGGELSISGAKDAAVFQWVALPASVKEVRATVEIKGVVPISGVVMLTLGWMSAENRHLGLTAVRLPEGKWPEWRTLLQQAQPPKGAAWVGLGVRVQHQQAESWVKIKDFALKVR